MNRRLATQGQRGAEDDRTRAEYPTGPTSPFFDLVAEAEAVDAILWAWGKPREIELARRAIHAIQLADFSRPVCRRAFEILADWYEKGWSPADPQDELERRITRRLKADGYGPRPTWDDLAAELRRQGFTEQAVERIRVSAEGSGIGSRLPEYVARIVRATAFRERHRELLELLARLVAGDGHALHEGA